MSDVNWMEGSKHGVVETCRITKKEGQYKLAWYDEGTPNTIIHITPFQMYLLIASLKAGVED